MTNRFDNGTNDEYYGEDEDDLDDFIVYSDDEDEDKALKKQKLNQQYEEDDLHEEEDHEEEFEEDEEEEEEEEEAPVGQQEILSLREQLKEDIRRKNAAMAAGVCKAGSSSSVNQQSAPPPAKDRFGTFFGPSRQSFSQRVIQEGCSSMMKELQNARPRNNASNISEGQPAGASRSLTKPKIVTKEKRKVDALRENRDYSSLFSDDAEASPSTKPDVQARGPENYAGKNRESNGRTAKLQSNEHGLKGAAPSSHGRMQNKSGSPGKCSVADRKGTIAHAARNGSSAAVMKKKAAPLQPSSNGQKLQPSLQSTRPHALLPDQRQQQSSQRQKLHTASQSQRLQSNSQHQIRKHASSAQGQRSGQNGSAKPHGRAKPAHALPSKLKASRPVEKGAAKRKSDDEVDISKEIGAIFGYDRSKYVCIDEDDSNMEADFSTIMNEEKRSAKLAKREDDEQLRLIQEEERMERATKRKRASASAR